MNINDPNPTGVPPEGPKDANTRDQMQEICREIDNRLPDGWGYVVLAFPFGDKLGRLNYASNGDRRDVIKLLKEFLYKAKKNEFGGHV